MQHVANSTHELRGWLDIIVAKDDCTIADLKVAPLVLSDHGLVKLTIPFFHEIPICVH